MATDNEIIRFRGMQGRTLADQERAIAAGYESVKDLAIDELARMLHELMQRVEQLERQNDLPSPRRFVDVDPLG